MSQETEGAAASGRAPIPLVTQPLGVVVRVDATCIEAGYNAAGETFLAIDAAMLDASERSTLRRLIQANEDAPRNPNWPTAHPLLPLRLERPTLEDFRAALARVEEIRRTAARVERCQARLRSLVREGLEQVLPRHEPAAGFYGDVLGSPAAAFPETVVREIREALGQPLAEASSELAMAMEDDGRALRAMGAKPSQEERNDYLLRVGALHAEPEDKEAVWRLWLDENDWLDRHLMTTPAWDYLEGFEGPWAQDHRDWASARSSVLRKAARERQRARSPQGMIEAVLRERGSESQVERFKEGVLPDEELDPILAVHLFEKVMAEAAPETRLERDDVARELRKGRPSASVTKVTFSTEEATGLDEGEWTRLKTIRQLLPEAATAHVVRTVASVQTAADGPFVLRRPLLSLKGTFAGREVRIRVDLGIGPTLRAA